MSKFVELIFFIISLKISDVSHGLVPFVPLKNLKNSHGGKLLKVTLLLGFSHVFKIFINGFKSHIRKASYIRKLEIFWF